RHGGKGGSGAGPQNPIVSFFGAGAAGAAAAAAAGFAGATRPLKWPSTMGFFFCAVAAVLPSVSSMSIGFAVVSALGGSALATGAEETTGAGAAVATCGGVTGAGLPVVAAATCAAPLLGPRVAK